MDLFIILFKKTLPLYFLILSGFICAKWVKIKKEDIGNLIIYLVSPVVVFTSVLRMDLTLSRLLLPFLFFFFCSSIGLLYYIVTPYILRPTYRGILSFAAGSGNAGFFGLPLIIYILGDHYVGITILCTVGYILFEYGLGFYFVARTHYSSRESILKVLKLPNIYALILAISLNFLGFRLPDAFNEITSQFRGAYAVLGMLLVGLGVGNIKRLRISWKFLTLGYLSKMVLWPAIVFFAIYLDKHHFHLFDEEIYKVMTILSLVPLPAITVAIATVFDTEPEEAAILVISHTIFATLYIPVFLALT
jgi:predicted permease